jgi:hypothetical protein
MAGFGGIFRAIGRGVAAAERRVVRHVERRALRKAERAGERHLAEGVAGALVPIPGGGTAPSPIGVDTSDFKRLRKDLRAFDKDIARAVDAGLKEAARPIAGEAAALAPRRTGALARSYRPYVRGGVVGVRSSLPYASLVEFGGTIAPRGAPITFRPSLPLVHATERHADDVVQAIDRELGAAAREHGFDWK